MWRLRSVEPFCRRSWKSSGIWNGHSRRAQTGSKHVAHHHLAKVALVNHNPREEWMLAEPMGPNIARSALIIVDMQNDFLHPDGAFATTAREHPEANIDMPFLVGTIPYARELAAAFRAAGRPVIECFATVLFPITQMRPGLTGG